MRFLAIKKTTMSNTNASKATVAASEAMQVVKQVAPKPRRWATRPMRVERPARAAAIGCRIKR